MDTITMKLQLVLKNPIGSDKPSLIIAKTVIGKGAPPKKVLPDHGAPLGQEEMRRPVASGGMMTRFSCA